MKKNIGLFFGSFNPIHVGHLIIGEYFSNYTDLNEVWYIVSPHNPHKNKKDLLNQYLRFDLVQKSIGDNNKLRASNIEFNLPQPSYTVNTLAYLEEKYPDYSFSLIMGEDNLKSLHKWKNFETIINEYNILIYPRAGFKYEGDLLVHSNIIMHKAPIIELSSTFIRASLADKKSIRYMVPENIHEVLLNEGFYQK